MNKYIKLEDVIRKRAEELADTSYWEYGNSRDVDDEWLEIAESELEDIPTIDIVHCRECASNECNTDGTTENWCYMFGYAVEDNLVKGLIQTKGELWRLSKRLSITHLA